VPVVGAAADHVEIMMLHGPTTLLDHVTNEEWLRVTDHLKRQGKARLIGFSEHARPAETLQRAAESGHYDVALVAFAAAKGKWGTDVKSMAVALKAAQKAEMGIMAMKAAMRAEQIVARMSAPKLKRKGCSPHQLCYRYVLDLPGVTAVACGMTNLTHVKENLAVPGIKLTAREADRLRRLAAAARVCGFCGTCLDACPDGVAVQDILRFDGYYGNGHRAAARAEYAALAPHERAAACRECGTCEQACPNRVPIRQLLRDAHRRLA